MTSATPPSLLLDLGLPGEDGSAIARQLREHFRGDFLPERTRGRDAGPFDRTIDVQIGRLRKKIEGNSERPELIRSVRGAGYVLTPSISAF